jgi:hypothetical protein
MAPSESIRPVQLDYDEYTILGQRHARLSHECRQIAATLVPAFTPSATLGEELQRPNVYQGASERRGVSMSGKTVGREEDRYLNGSRYECFSSMTVIPTLNSCPQWLQV